MTGEEAFTKAIKHKSDDHENVGKLVPPKLTRDVNGNVRAVEGKTPVIKSLLNLIKFRIEFESPYYSVKFDS